MQADTRGSYFKSILARLSAHGRGKCGENGRHNKFAVYLTITWHAREKMWVPVFGLDFAESADQLPGSPQPVRGAQKDVRASLKTKGSKIATRTSTLAILERN